MKDKIKIVTIGGGSSYTPELIEGFIKRYDELPVGEIWLVDIEAGKEKLEIVGALAKRMVHKSLYSFISMAQAKLSASSIVSAWKKSLSQMCIRDRLRWGRLHHAGGICAGRDTHPQIGRRRHLGKRFRR